MSCVKFLKNHFIICKRRGFRLFRFVTDNFCLRTSCSIHSHCLEETSTTGETFSQKERDRHEGEDFSQRGELLIRHPAIIYRYNVSPGRIITGKYPPGETFLGGDLATGHRQLPS